MRVIRKHCEPGERSDEEEAVSNGSWKELSEVQEDCNIKKKGWMKLMDQLCLSPKLEVAVYLTKNNTRMLIS